MIVITLLMVTLPSFKNHSLMYVHTLPHLPTILKELVSNPGCCMQCNTDNLRTYVRTYMNGTLKANKSVSLQEEFPLTYISFGKTRRITLQGGLFTLCAYVLYIMYNSSYTYGIHP